jgi:hypothetical protein
VAFNSFYGVLGTGRIKTAMRPNQWTNQVLIYLDRYDQDATHDGFLMMTQARSKYEKSCVLGIFGAP